jgi:elongation factor G
MRAFTILGPSQSGKTTLAESLAALEGRPTAIPIGDSLTLRTFRYLGEDWASFDIAGGGDHLPAAAQALAASDAAVLCVPPDPDAAPLSAPYLRLAEASGVPVFLFVNRMDQAQSRIRDTVAALQSYAAHAIILRQVPIREDGHVTGAVDLISERAWHYEEGRPSSLVQIPDDLRDREREARTELLEHLADFDDVLLEQLIEDKAPPTDRVYALIADLHRHNDIIAAYLGAASHMNGVNRLMKSLRHEAPSPEDTLLRLGLGSGVTAIGIAADQKKHVGKSILLRDFGGKLAQGAPLGGAPLGALQSPNGGALSAPLAPGALALALRSDHLDRGGAFTPDEALGLPEWTRGTPPALRRVLTPAQEKDDARLSAAMARLAAVDPGLATGQDEATGHVTAAFQGPMHLRATLDRLAADFGVEAQAAPVPPSYRETIRTQVHRQHRHKKQTGGAGQFAEVHLSLRPLPRGEGFRFEETVKGGTVPRNYIPAVEQGARDAMAAGPHGFPVVDVAVTLTDGKAHAVDSSDHAFRLAAAACAREALREAQPVVLQPIDRVAVHLPSVWSGALVGLVSSLKGQVQGFEAHPTARGWDIFRALIPQSARDELLQSLGGLAHGTGWLVAELDHYEDLHPEEAERVRKVRAEAAA